MSNILPFALKLRYPDAPGRKSAIAGLLRVSSDGRVRAESTDIELQPYLADLAAKLNRRGVLTVSTIGPDNDGRFDSWNRVVERDDPEFLEALKLRVESEYGFIVEDAA